MCGIVGILGRRPVIPLLLDGLKRLEYRGYDSAGIASLENGVLERVRAAGKLHNLEKKLENTALKGQIGIGHTRWATHGGPTENNAHPHMNEDVAVVHNGIIENFAPLREELQKEGYQFATQTDTEVLVYLLARELKKGLSPIDGLRACLKQITGAFALAFLLRGEEDLILIARHGAPLAIGYGDGEMYLGSDALALAGLTDKITYMEDGDWGMLTRDKLVLYNEVGCKVERAVIPIGVSSLLVSKGEYRHFMQKEIYEQPEVLSRTLAHYVDFHSASLQDNSQIINWQKIDHIHFSACGTAYYATLVARYLFESLAGITTDSDVASEFRYRDIAFAKNSLSFFVSQSGETADSLAALRYCRKDNIPTAALINVAGSTMAREADYVFPTLSGPEIGVASTKAFTCQLAALTSLALASARARGRIDRGGEEKIIRELGELSRIVHQIIKLDSEILKICRSLMHAKNILYLGRGTSYPIALEGALKLKELSYIHAEGYAAGELKHGPIALIDEKMPIIIVAPYDRWFEKMVSNIQEVAARGGPVILITTQQGRNAAKIKEEAVILMPEMPEILTPIVYSLPVQLIAYHMAVLLGTDVDQPRNLAKSVTVE